MNIMEGRGRERWRGRQGERERECVCIRERDIRENIGSPAWYAGMDGFSLERFNFTQRKLFSFLKLFL